MTTTTEDRRTIRIPEPLWAAAKNKAEQHGTTISQVMRDTLANYTQEDTN